MASTENSQGTKLVTNSWVSNSICRNGIIKVKEKSAKKVERILKKRFNKPFFQYLNEYLSTFKISLIGEFILETGDNY